MDDDASSEESPKKPRTALEWFKQLPELIQTLTKVFANLTALVLAAVAFWHVVLVQSGGQHAGAASKATSPDPCNVPFEDKLISCLPKE